MIPRPSSLPKLALCGQYESTPGEAGPSAQRGTMLDGVFRAAWETGEFPRDLSDDDAASVRWGLNALMSVRFSEKDVIETTEIGCRVSIPGMDHIGTADAICVAGQWSADLKTGQIYDYRHQMAAYALGLMHEHMVGNWTTHLLFSDQQKIITHRFSYQRAQLLVEEALKNIGKPPVINDYCGWCKHSLTCSARVEAATAALATTTETFSAMLANPSLLGQFLLKCKTFDDFRDAAIEEARRLLGDGVEVSGWRLQKPRVTEFVNAEVLIGNLANLDAVELLRAHGNMSAVKARKLWADVPVERKESKPALVALR